MGELIRWDATMGIFTRSLGSPVTTVCLILMAMVFAGTHGTGDSTGLSERRRAWGSVEVLTWVMQDGEANEAKLWQEGLSGPFELWDGQWWRVLISVLHHADFLHLFLNSLSLAVLGPLLERCWGSWRYAIFLLGASVASSWPEYLLGGISVGFSGVICAVFGALWGVSRYRPHLAQVMTPAVLLQFALVLLLMAILTDAGAMNVANLAHFMGLAYGWVIGTVVAIPWTAPRAVTAGLVAAHVLFVIPFWAITHPVWNGRYHWYLASVTPEGRPRTVLDVALLQRAVVCDPSLTGVWKILADQELAAERPLAAWRLLLRGLTDQPVNSSLWPEVRRQWRRLVVSEDRQAAVEEVKLQFGEQSPLWLAEIRKVVPSPVLIGQDQAMTREPAVPLEEPESRRWAASPDPWWWRGHLPRARLVTPDDPQNAAEGQLL